MITPSEIKTRALRYWNNQRFLQSSITQQSLFPLDISFRKFSAKHALDNFDELRNGLQLLRTASKEKKKYSYSIEYKEVQHRQLGQQNFPQRIFFETPEDFLEFTGKKREFSYFLQHTDQILAHFPVLRDWLSTQPLKVLEYQTKWPSLLKVCDYFINNPRPHRYLRELEIPDIDSKFIENNKAILQTLLDVLLPTDAVEQNITRLSNHGFEKRYGLKYEEPLVRFRILDPTLTIGDGAIGKGTIGKGITDISIPVSEFKSTRIPCQRVFITENKLNGLAFPAQHKSIVIFGLGYGINSISDTAWLEDKEIIYWGDIDTHGFAILSQLRSYYPAAQSFLMDKKTMVNFKSLWVHEPDNKRFTGHLQNLTDAEQALFDDLKNNLSGKNVRLEQERINLQYVIQKLQQL